MTPCMFALGSGARFIARGIDVHKNLPEVLKAAHAHRGASFVEIYQNCVVYNDDVFASFTDKGVAPDNQLWLKAGEKMLFANGEKGLALDVDDAEAQGRRRRRSRGHRPRSEEPRHRRHADRIAARLPGRARRDLRRPRADLRKRAVVEQNRAAAEGKTPDLQKLVAKGQTWQVEKEPRAEVEPSLRAG